jgi:hypothetical protein
VAILRLGLALLLAAAAGCFSPNRPPCAFSCVDDGICPSGYSCQSDGICHRDDGQGVCVIPPLIDAGQDATDAGSDDAAPADGSGADGG